MSFNPFDENKEKKEGTFIPSESDKELDSAILDTANEAKEEADKLEAVLRANGMGEIVDFIKTAVDESANEIQKKAQEKVESIKDKASEAITAAAMGRLESDIPMNDNYWRVKNNVIRSLGK